MAATNDPIRVSTLLTYYDGMDASLQPLVEKSKGTVTVDTVNQLLAYGTADFTSTNWTPISPTLNVTIFDDTIGYFYLVLLPIYINITTLSCVAEIGISVNGVVDTDSIIRVSSTAGVATSASAINGSLLFVVARPDFSSTVAFVPSVRIISGATPNIRIRWTESLRTIVRHQ